MAALPDRVPYCIDISNALLPRREKMEHGAIVPNVISAWNEIGFGNVRNDPVNPFGGLFQTCPSHVDCGLGDIKDGYVLIAFGKEIIHERGFTAAYVNDGR